MKKLECLTMFAIHRISNSFYSGPSYLNNYYIYYKYLLTYTHRNSFANNYITIFY